MTERRITITTKKKKPTKKKVTPKPAKAPKAKQAQMFDTQIESLEKLANDYEEAEEQATEYRKQMDVIQGELIAEMKRLGKKHYLRDGIELKFVEKSERVKVTVKDKETSNES